MRACRDEEEDGRDFQRSSALISNMQSSKYLCHAVSLLISEMFYPLSDNTLLS